MNSSFFKLKIFETLFPFQNRHLHFKDQRIINYLDFLYLKTPWLNVKSFAFLCFFIFSKYDGKISTTRLWISHFLFFSFFFKEYIVHWNNIKTIASLKNYFVIVICYYLINIIWSYITRLQECNDVYIQI